MDGENARGTKTKAKRCIVYGENESEKQRKNSQFCLTN